MDITGAKNWTSCKGGENIFGLFLKGVHQVPILNIILESTFVHVLGTFNFRVKGGGSNFFRGIAGRDEFLDVKVDKVICECYKEFR